MGAVLGIWDGNVEGFTVGCILGIWVGNFEGDVEGFVVGIDDGLYVGLSVGNVGTCVGAVAIQIECIKLKCMIYWINQVYHFAINLINIYIYSAWYEITNMTAI